MVEEVAVAVEQLRGDVGLVGHLPDGREEDEVGEVLPDRRPVFSGNEERLQQYHIRYTVVMRDASERVVDAARFEDQGPEVVQHAELLRVGAVDEGVQECFDIACNFAEYNAQPFA